MRGSGTGNPNGGAASVCIRTDSDAGTMCSGIKGEAKMAQKLTREAVDQAITEYRDVGGAAFRKKYGFGGARDYFLVVDGENLDSKAIVGAAHQFLPGGRALGPANLSGGMADAAGKLIALGYEVLMPGQNADWSWDEHVLALDLYMTHRKAIPGKKSSEIVGLSGLLGALGKRTGVAMTPKFRNPNGVYMKMMNFRRVDPEFTSQGKAGLTRGAGLEQRVWDAYESDLPLLKAHADAIRFAIGDHRIPLTLDQHEDDYEGEEGGTLLKLHVSRERDRKLIRRKREQVKAQNGRLVCEVCSLDFGDRYGEHGRGYIEVHHLKPVAGLGAGGKTKLSDLALVCANCHRMLHRGKRLMNLTELRATMGLP